MNRSTKAEGIFAALWTLQHAIETAPGGIGDPTQTVLLEKNQLGDWVARELPGEELQEHRGHKLSRAIALWITGRICAIGHSRNASSQTSTIVVLLHQNQNGTRVRRPNGGQGVGQSHMIFSSADKEALHVNR
jgi:hypothetical protein